MPRRSRYARYYSLRRCFYKRGARQSVFADVYAIHYAAGMSGEELMSSHCACHGIRYATSRHSATMFQCHAASRRRRQIETHYAAMPPADFVTLSTLSPPPIMLLPPLRFFASSRRLRRFRFSATSFSPPPDADFILPRLLLLRLACCHAVCRH